MTNIILLAPPLSGKGTQASLLKDSLNLIHISIGDMLREATKEDNELSRELKEVLSTGKLVSDELVINLLKEKITQEKDSNGFIFDGFPRTINQAQALDDLFGKFNMKIDYVFLLDLEKEILEKRVTGRRICKKCNRIYNIYNEEMKPKIDNLCDDCNIELTIRADDNLDSFQVRYQEYLDKTYPLIEYYKNKGNLLNIDANKSIDEVYNNILSIVNKNI